DEVLAAQVGPGGALARRPQAAQKGRTATPAACRADLTVAATAGAFGPSPWTHKVSAVTTTSPRSRASTGVPVANATARAATASGSETTAPSIERGASSPLER